MAAGRSGAESMVSDLEERIAPVRSAKVERAIVTRYRIGKGRHVMAYSIEGGKSFNMVLSHPEDSDPSTWNQSSVIEDMKKHFQGWDPW